MFNLDIILSVLFNQFLSNREQYKYMPRPIPKPKYHLVKAEKEYTKDELMPLKGKESSYIFNALRKDKILEPFSIEYRASGHSEKLNDNFFTILSFKNKVIVTIRINIKGEEYNPIEDELYAQRMYYILNFLPFMADV